MLGLFLLNAEGNICFVQDSRAPDIASIHYAPQSKMVVAVLKDGHEETFSSEIIPEIHEALLACEKILAVYLDTKDEVQREYEVPLTRG
jgi:hypothetical protein